MMLGKGVFRYGRPVQTRRRLLWPCTGGSNILKYHLIPKNRDQIIIQIHISTNNMQLSCNIHIQNQEIFDNPGNSGKASTIPAESVSPENAGMVGFRHFRQF